MPTYDKVNPTTGAHYYDSPGNGGIWHIYHDGHKVFVADPVKPLYTGWGSGGTPAPAAPAPVTPPAVVGSTAQPTTGGTPTPAPAPNPIQKAEQLAHPFGSTGGTPAPVPTPPAVVGSTAQPTVGPGSSGSSTFGSTGGTPAPTTSTPAPAPNPIQKAEQLAHPFGGAPAVSTAVVTSGPQPASNSPTVGGATHVVVHGDTLSGIAAANGLSVSKLEALNPQIKNPNLIFPGQTVNLGGGTPTSGVTGGNPSSTDFPKSSSYQSSGSVSGGTGTETPINKSGGWGSGTGNVPADPAKGAINVATNQDTNPLGKYKK
jgi:LysM repeat protein